MSTQPFLGPFRADRARAAGITRNVLSGPRFQRVGHGLYVPAAFELTLAARAAAALMVLPNDAVLTGITALHLHGVEVGDPLPIRAVTATRTQTQRAEIRLTRAQRLPPGGRRIANPTAAWLAACSELDLLDAVAAGDWLVFRRLATVQVLVESATAYTGRGCRLARRAAALVVEKVESPQETRGWL